VQNETFHIQDFRDHEAKQKENGDTVEKNFDNIELPYEFKLRACIIMLLLYLSISVVAFSFVFTNFTVIDSLYFACVTLTTIGYGDITPVTRAGKLFCAVFALMGVGVLAIGLGVLGVRKEVLRVFNLHLIDPGLQKVLDI
jgi:voltage-gated potassium channel Kch